MPEDVTFNCVPTSHLPFGCIELYAGNERTHNHVSLPGLEGSVISVPFEGSQGGDLYAMFSCGDARYARVVLADASGHGFTASGAANHIHHLLHSFSDVRDTAGLLAALNESFVLGESRDAPLHFSTVATATFDVETGEFNYAYAAHPRMIQWIARERVWTPLEAGLGGLPLGVIAGVEYSQQSVRLDAEDAVLAFSDALTEVDSPAGEPLKPEGLLRLASVAMNSEAGHTSLLKFSQAVLCEVEHYHGARHFNDDVTLLALRRLG